MSLHDLYRQHHERVQFLSVYIREAHPTDGWWLGKGLIGWFARRWETRVAIDVQDPRTLAERQAVAGRCEGALKYGIRTYVDEMDDAVNEAYAGWPTRLYLVGLDGRVVYHGGLGPYGFSPKRLGRAIEDYLTTLPDPA